MKEVIYELKTPVDGVKELALFAPTRKHLKFAAFVKSSFMQVAIEMAEKLGDRERTSGDEDLVLTGDQMLATLYSGSVDVGELLERFQSGCTNSSLCKMNGGAVPEEFWDGMSMEDVEGLFASFLGNFITIV